MESLIADGRTVQTWCSRALVVDGDPDTAEVLSLLFSALGQDARYALRGRDALKLTRTFDPALVLIELELPDISGLELVRALRSSEREARRHIVATTSWQRPENRRRALAAGFDDFYLKPIDLATVRRIVLAASTVSTVS